MFSKILIANRGEIAVRIIRACKEMGIATVAVYSAADADSLHAALADESYCIGGAEASDSYLNQERIVSAACLAGAQAIHPGYGFLSESADFAQLCKKNGIVFIGPSPDIMEKISDKASLKEQMEAASMQVIPGTMTLSSEEAAIIEAEKLGYPVMLKASAGGGGRGIRLAKNSDEVRVLFPQASAEAETAFGDGSVYLEKYIYPARHIEFQILADEAGNVIIAGERDCSLQRRHQKLVEESPSPAVTADMREKVIKTLRRAIRQIGYTGIGTAEFLLDAEGTFWFMEMNIRLQVEHCVSEMLTGIDLVKWQIRIAAGILLPFHQEQIRLSGTAIECRINAVGCGTVGMLHIPGGPQVRFDTYLLPGTEILPFYDALIGKLIVCARTREEAIRKMNAALCELLIEGVQTNTEEQLGIIDDERFLKGTYDLDFMGNR